MVAAQGGLATLVAFPGTVPLTTISAHMSPPRYDDASRCRTPNHPRCDPRRVTRDLHYRTSCTVL